MRCRVRLFLHFAKTNLVYYFITDIIQLLAASSIIHYVAWRTIYSSNFSQEKKNSGTQLRNIFHANDEPFTILNELNIEIKFK